MLTIAAAVAILGLANAPRMHLLAAGAGDNAPPVLEFALVDAGVGWALTPCALLWTADDGATWRALQPPAIDLTAPVAIAFSDARHGLVVQPVAGQRGAVQVARTADAGASWSQQRVQLLDATAPAAAVAHLSIQLLDAHNGWLLLHRATSSNFSLGALFFTADGGGVWTERTLPAGAAAYFLDTQRGWAGSADGTELWQTVDGGATWTPVPIPPVADAVRLRVGLPLFASDRQQAILPLLVTTATGQRRTWLASTDAGATWRSWTPQRSGNDVHTWLWPRQEQQNALSRPTAAPVINIPWPHAVAVSRASYSSTAHGWGSGAGQRLLRTDDGGQSWQVLDLPACAAADVAQRSAAAPGATIPPASPAALVSLGAGPAFDSCELPTAAELAIWRTASPYRIVNLYIGGVLRACANRTLTAATITALAGAGWRFIPTWVGPQAPCSDYRAKFSATPAVAYEQGRTEAQQALAVAQALGLTSAAGGGTVIYYDLEAFDGVDTACVAAAQAFVQGWSRELRGRSSLAGLYAAACFPSLGAYAQTPAPDAVWIAHWVRPAYDPAVTVWDVACVDNSLWNRGQRIRQYTGGHDETWGNVTLNIDASVAAGPVADPALAIAAPTTVVVEEALLQPADDGDLCSSAWHRYLNERGFPAYLTLNRRQGDPPPPIVNSASWTPQLPISGTYQVEVYLPAHPAVNWVCPAALLESDSASARYTIHHADGATERVIDQMAVRNGWINLGRYSFTVDGPARVTLSDATDEVQFSVTLSVSAARFTFVAEETATPLIWLPITVTQ